MGFLLLQESVNADFILQKNCFTGCWSLTTPRWTKKNRQWPFCEIFRSNKFNAILNKKVKSEKKRNFLTNVAFKVDSITEASVDADVVTDTEAVSRVESNMTSITFL